MDCLATSHVSQAADIVAQRLKALEKSQVDAGSWARAQFLELIAPGNSTMIMDGEERQANRDFKSNRDLRLSWGGKGDDEWPKGNGSRGSGPAFLTPGPDAWAEAADGPKGGGKNKDKESVKGGKKGGWSKKGKNGGKNSHWW